MTDFVYIRPSIYCLKEVKAKFYRRYNRGLLPPGYKGWRDHGKKNICPAITVLVEELPEIFDWFSKQRLSDYQTKRRYHKSKRTASSNG